MRRKGTLTFNVYRTSTPSKVEESKRVVPVPCEGLGRPGNNHIKHGGQNGQENHASFGILF